MSNSKLIAWYQAFKKETGKDATPEELLVWLSNQKSEHDVAVKGILFRTLKCVLREIDGSSIHISEHISPEEIMVELLSKEEMETLAGEILATNPKSWSDVDDTIEFSQKGFVGKYIFCSYLTNTVFGDDQPNCKELSRLATYF